MITLEDKNEWVRIRDKIAAEYGQPMVLISSRMKRELGFTKRGHRPLVPGEEWKTVVCLDFYDDAKELWFKLKYL